MGIKGILAAIMGLTLSGMDARRNVFHEPAISTKPQSKRTKYQGERNQRQRRKWHRQVPHMRNK